MVAKILPRIGSWILDQATKAVSWIGVVAGWR